MEFLYGVIATILVIAFLIWGFLSVLGNEKNPASYFIALLMNPKYNWLLLLLVGIGSLIIYYFKYLK